VEVGGDALDAWEPSEDRIEQRLGGEVEEAAAGHIAAGDQQRDRAVAGM
jgi:hypothetical protein